jgi:GH35 family endo-1,4-beta-xylanase
VLFRSGVYTFGNVNTALACAKKVGWPLRGHCLLWGDTQTHDDNKLPGWVRALTPAKAIYDTCQNRIMNTMAYYKGKINDYDVLNEPTHADWLQTQFGDSINWKCFKWAKQADSTAELYLNDYNTIEQPNDEYRAFNQVVRKVIAKGGPITGIGIQGHFGNSVDENMVQLRLDSLAQFGLPLKITEFDFNMSSTPITEAQQATGFAKMMRIAFSYPAINGFIFWGYWNQNQWRKAGIYNTDKTPKLAADSVFNLIHKEWTTSIDGKTATDGSLNFRGFYGNYEVTVKAGDSLKLFRINCIKENDGSEFILRENEGEIPGPVLVNAAITYYDTLELTFNKKMADPSVEKNNFSVFDQNSNIISVAKLKAGNPNVISMHLNRNLTYANVVNVSYQPGGQISADSGKLEAFNMIAVSNPLPGIILQETDTTGSYVVITFNRDINDPSSQISHFTIKVNSSVDTIISASLKQDNSSVMLLLLKKPILNGQTVVFAYIPGTLTATNGFPIPQANLSFVTNKVPKLNSIESAKANEITMFPNPAQDKLRITNINGMKTITISTILGQEIFKASGIRSNYLDINISQFQKGIYIVSFTGQNSSIKALKLIKY